MISAKNITNRNKNIREIKDLLRSSFPKAERVPFWLLMLRAKFKSVEFLAFYYNSRFCGLAYLVTHENMTFILYLAVDSKLRSKGYGSRILNIISERYKNNTIILDIEAIDKTADNFEQRKKRKNFYLSNGYASSGYGFILDDVAYEVLQKGEEFDSERCIKLFKNFSLGMVKIRLYPISALNNCN
jgi:GNAT superfamily N-acetyltransferase